MGRTSVLSDTDVTIDEIGEIWRKRVLHIRFGKTANKRIKLILGWCFKHQYWSLDICAKSDHVLRCTYEGGYFHTSELILKYGALSGNAIPARSVLNQVFTSVCMKGHTSANLNLLAPA